MLYNCQTLSLIVAKNIQVMLSTILKKTSAAVNMANKQFLELYDKNNADSESLRPHDFSRSTCKILPYFLRNI